MNSQRRAQFRTRLKRLFTAGSVVTLTAAAAGCGREAPVRETSPEAASGKLNTGIGETGEKLYEGEKPNVLYIVLDDAGFSSLGSFGSEISTPNMDRLAESGLVYNNFTATPLSSPTRASLLTGRNHHSVGMAGVSNVDLGEDLPFARGRIRDEAGTTAEILKEYGYSTYALGKWHLAPYYESGASGPFDDWPLGKGFERYYGFLSGETDQFEPAMVIDNTVLNISPGRDNPGYHVTQDLVDSSIQMIRDLESVTPEKPFFLYLALGAVHAAHQVPEEYMAKYRGVYDAGWDVIREQRFNRQKELGIIPREAELAASNPNVKAWDSLSDDEKRLYARFHEAFAGFLEHTDDQVGRLIDYLESIDELDNTVIVLLSDNGASQEGGINGSINLTSLPNGLAPATEDMLPHIDEIGGPDTGSNFPLGWAQANNTPFPYYKRTTHFGGIRTPLIISWPDGIQSPGSVRSQFHNVIDIAPTIYDILGITPPEVIRGVEQMPIHGTSLAYTFNEPDAPGRRTTQHFAMISDRAIWHEGWAAVAKHAPKTEITDDRWELYNTNEDFSQSRDLADQNPEKLAELKRLWMEEAKKYDVLPLTTLSFQLFTYIHDDSPVRRSEYLYYPGMSVLPSGAAAPVVGRSHEITIPVERADENAEGVLVAHGNHEAGYVIYIRDNRLVYEYRFPEKVFRIESDREMPVGSSIVELKYTRKFPITKKEHIYQGKAELFIDGRKVGKADIRTVPFRMSEEGLSIGYDAGKPVSSAYEEEREFPFTGTLGPVSYTVGKDGPWLKDIVPKLLTAREEQMKLEQL